MILFSLENVLSSRSVYFFLFDDSLFQGKQTQSVAAVEWLGRLRAGATMLQIKHLARGAASYLIRFSYVDQITQLAGDRDV